MRTLGPAVVNTAALGLSSGLNFLALFLWTRLLDPQAFGSYALISATALLLNSMLFEWLRLVGARTLYDPGSDTGISIARGEAMMVAFGIAILVFATAIGALWASGTMVLGLRPEWLPIIFAFVMTEMALAIVNTVSRLRLRSWQFFRSLVGRSLLSITIGVVLVAVFHRGAMGVVLGTVIAQAIVVGASFAFDPVWRTFRIWRATRDNVLHVIRFGYPLIASSVLTYGVAVADRYLVGGVLGTRAVGFYAAPADLLQKTVVFAMLAINLSAYPSLVRAYEDRGEDAARGVLEQNFLVQLLLGFPAAVFFVVLAPGLSSLLLGRTFRDEAAVLLPYLGATALLRCFVAYHLTMAFQITGRMKLMVVAPAVTLCVLIPAGLFGMHHFGLVGMAVAALVAQVASYATTAVLALRVFRFRLVTPDTLKVMAAGVVMGLCLLPFARFAGPLATVAAVAAGGLIYGVALLALRIEPLAPVVRHLRAFAGRPVSAAGPGD